MNEESKKNLEEITEQLEAGVKDIFTSGKYEQYLCTMAKFYKYSATNCILIYIQKPDATLVAGYQSWQKNFKRQVKKGEKGIKILAPIPHKFKKLVENEEGEQEEQEISYTSFRAVSVFDISQTDGEELPSILSKLSGDVSGYDDLIEKLKKVSAVPVVFDEISGTANGFFDPKGKRIVIREGMSQLQTVKTMVHEIAHSILHNLETGEQKEATKEAKEVQAESTAYTVCKALGIDTSEYSFGYVAGWSAGRDLKELQESLEIIRKTSHNLLEAIEAA